ncbi:MAG TPA: CdaR family protein [Candidatus Paceibacterota bacterium]|nr:CdaR family protein [Verrucomicrobiota bacterium]HRY47746.1 CdaR family protein [Candidatus Paceibacterota bacterium]HSA03208.1 CdaR family protein [Candidatus Paceibacterota bacterium]
MWRKLIVHNYPWKLCALALAIITWLVIHQRVIPDMEFMSVHEYASLPVRVLRLPNDNRSYEVTPSTVTVALRGPSFAVKKLHETNLEVFINLTSEENADLVSKRVEVVVPSSVEVVRIVPSRVTIRLTPSPAPEKPSGKFTR